MSDAALAEIAGAAFTRLHSDGGVGRTLGHFAGGIQRGGDRQVLLAGLAQESTTGSQTSHMVLSPAPLCRD